MASRNERKRKAKARHVELVQAVDSALEIERLKRKAENDARNAYVARVTDALRNHKAPISRQGKVVGGQFIRTISKEEAPRKLSLNPVTGKLIEKRKRTY